LMVKAERSITSAVVCRSSIAVSCLIEKVGQALSPANRFS